MNAKEYSLELKYRPQTFDEVIGNKETIESLKIMLSKPTGRKHTLMLCGPSGTGKTTLARIIAKELKAGDLDIREINVSDTRGIDAARSLIGTCGLAPLSGEATVYILNEIHGATKEWQNAMLVALEQPPKHVYFILVTTEPEKLIPTILQRAMTFPVTHSEQHEIVSLLWRILEKEKAQDFPKKLVDEIAVVASGSPRQALTLLDQVIDMPDEEMALRIIERVVVSMETTSEPRRVLREVKRVEDSRDRNKDLPEIEPETLDAGEDETPETETADVNGRKHMETAHKPTYNDYLTPTKEGKKPEFRLTLPLPLTSLPHWVVWQRQKIGDGRPTKIPINPKTGKNAKSNDPETWASCDEALSYYEMYRDGLAGLGFQFGNSEFVGIDLDRCRNPETGEIESWALEIIKEVNSYTEISPSRTGVHIIVRGELPRGARRKGKVEIYGSGHFFAMTGNRIPGTPTQPRERRLHGVWERYLCNEREMKEVNPGIIGLTPEDNELIERAKAAANGHTRREHGGSSYGSYGSFHTDFDLIACVRFPFEVLPPSFQSLIETYATALHVARELVALMMMCTMSGAIGNTVRVLAKSGYEVPLFLWVLIIKETGYGQSPAQNAILDPVRVLQARNYGRYEIEQKAYREALRKAKAGESIEIPEEPRPKHRMVSDITIAALADVFDKDGRGVICDKDELSGFVQSFNQYRRGDGDDRQKWLTMFSCGPWKIDRKSGTRYIRNTGAAIIGGIQPEILPAAFDDTAFADGLLPRFLLYHPKRKVIKFSREGISEDTAKEWENVLSHCYQISYDLDENGFVSPKKLLLREEALDQWVDFHDHYAAITPFLSRKARVFIPKLTSYYSLKFAGILHVLDCIFSKEDITTVITKKTIEGAITLTRFFMWHAVKALELYTPKQKHLTEYHEQLIRVLHDLQVEVKNGKLALSRIREALNCRLPLTLQLTPEKVARLLKELDLTTDKSTGNLSVLMWEEIKIRTLISQTVTSVTTVPDQEESGMGDTAATGTSRAHDREMEKEAYKGFEQQGGHVRHTERLPSPEELEEDRFREEINRALNSSGRLQAFKMRGLVKGADTEPYLGNVPIQRTIMN